MRAYLIRRTLQAIVVLFGVSVLVFILLHLLPGGPAKAVLGLRATKPAIRAFDQRYGLLKPLPVQYLAWVGQLLHGNLGFSYKQNQSVDSLLAEDMPRTLVLVGVATLLALAIAIPGGIYQAARRNKPDDYVLTGMTFLFYSMPSFFLGTILIILLSQALPVLPSTGPTAISPLFDQIPNLVLPILTLTLVNLALFSRYMRSSVLENMVQDYVRTASSKGASRPAILFRHVLPNALLPIITLVGLSLPGILSGALITESLFNYPGMGLLFWNAAQTDDFPVMLGTTIVVGVGVVVGSLLADILYAVFDPRVRYA
ncbi:MAG: ABC transporter permease [Candidatus Dormibacteria bacterium]|jgi:peptide/nickel transport system permease protein